MEFEWDARKATKNLRQHEVSFGEAATVFADPLRIPVPDPYHSIQERRYLTIGMSSSAVTLPAWMSKATSLGM